MPLLVLHRRGTELLMLLAGGAFGVAMDGSQFVPILADVAADLRATPPQIGQVFGAGALLATLVVLVGGPLSDCYGRRPMLLGGAGLMALANVGTVAATDYGTFLLVRLVSALGAALLMPAAFAAVADFLPARQAAGVGVLTGVTGLPYLAGWPLVGLATALAGWRAVPLAMAALFALLAVGYAAIVPRHGAQAAAGTAAAALRSVVHSYASLVAAPPVRLGLAISASAAASWFGFVTYVGTFLRAAYALGPADVALLLALLGGGYVLGGGLVGYVVSRWGQCPIVVGAFLLLGVLLVALLAGRGPLALTAVALAAAGVSRAVGLSAYTALYLDLTHLARGTGQALNAAVFTLGISAGAAGGGLVVAVADYSALGIVCAALAIAAALGAARLNQAHEE